MEHTQPKPRPLAIWNPVTDRWEREQETIFGHSDAYSETWPTSGMTVNGVAYELPTWEHHTDDSGSSSLQHEGTLLRTPAAAAAEGGALSPERAKIENRTLRLSGQMIDLVAPDQFDTKWKDSPQRAGTLLPTPTTSEATGAGRSEKKTGGENLRTAVTLLPTPKAGDGEMHTPMTSGRPVEKSTHLGTIAMLQAGHLEHRRTGESTRLQLPDGRPVEEPPLPLQN